eukprot:7002885-Prymnesium_polylepis.3
MLRQSAARRAAERAVVAPTRPGRPGREAGGCRETFQTPSGRDYMWHVCQGARARRMCETLHQVVVGGCCGRPQSTHAAQTERAALGAGGGVAAVAGP